MASGLHLLLTLALALVLVIGTAQASKGPMHLEFFLYIAVQNNSNLDNPIATYTAVQMAQPLSPQADSFGVIHTFDSPLTSVPDLDSIHLGRVQGWYGDVGQDLLTLLLVQTFNWNDGKYKGTFSLLGVDVATDALKSSPIVGGTGDFAYSRGVAQQALFSTANVDQQTVSWFHYAIDFKY